MGFDRRLIFTAPAAGSVIIFELEREEEMSLGEIGFSSGRGMKDRPFTGAGF